MASAKERISCVFATSRPSVATPKTIVHTSIMVRMVSESTVLSIKSQTHAPSTQPSTTTVITVAIIFRLNSFFAIVQLHS